MILFRPSPSSTSFGVAVIRALSPPELRVHLPVFADREGDPAMSMRFNITLTWGEWRPHWFDLPEYLAIGIGPIFIEFDWGRGLALWEQ